MKSKRKAPDGRTSKGSIKEYATMVQYRRHNYYITIMMAVTTAIASLHIDDLWSGIIAALCTMITIWMVYEEVGGLDDE